MARSTILKPEGCHGPQSHKVIRGTHVAPMKKTWNGQMERRSLLEAQGIKIPGRLDRAGSIPPDDVLDAAAAAWTAMRVSRGEAEVLPKSATGCSPVRRRVIWM